MEPRTSKYEPLAVLWSTAVSGNPRYDRIAISRHVDSLGVGVLANNVAHEQPKQHSPGKQTNTHQAQSTTGGGR